MIDVGHSVGNYNITAKLGEGGMGTVFLAEHPVIGSKVALKAIRPEFAQSGEVFARFVNEAKAVNQIGHDHIIDITDFGIARTGDCYFMMEYLEGDTLSGAIKRSGALPPARALNIAAQIADALSAAHEHGVIHRDLKPENIFLIVRDGSRDFVKVLDFGLAKLTHADELGMYPSRAASTMGSPYYMSPEQCEGRAEIDHRSDVYALGVMLFEMLTGKIPFGGKGYGELLVKHMSVAPPAARSIVPTLSPALDAILLRALSKAREDRFASMADFRRALEDPESYASATPLADASSDMTEPTRAALPMARAELELHPPKPTRHRGRTALLMGLALAAVAAAGVKFRKQTRDFLAAAAAPNTPSSVQVNFSSDPSGATVVEPGGAVLGVTPLSTNVAFGDRPIEYVFRSNGYLSKSISIVPNVPSPVFAVLQKDPSAARPEPPRTIAEPSPP